MCIIILYHVYHVPRRHMIYRYIHDTNAWHDIWWYNSPFGKHDTNMISQKIKWWYIAYNYHVPYHVHSDIILWYTWYMDLIPEWHDLGYEMTNNLDLYYDTNISSYIYQYHGI
jgi:hypothetical protein